VNDPTRYVDASRIPFIVLPGAMAREIGARPGRLRGRFNQRNGQSSYAIFGDVGPSTELVKARWRWRKILESDPMRRNGGARRGILFLVFPGSGNGSPRSIEEINSEAAKLLQAWEELPS